MALNPSTSLLFSISKMSWKEEKGRTINIVGRRRENMKRILLVIAVITVLIGCNKHAVEPTSNALMVIEPYRHAGTWVFDDPRVGLRAEPFVSGIPEIIDKLVTESQIADADEGFRLLFSAQPFPGHQIKLLWQREEAWGNWYYCPKYDAEGWLCPALFKYFKRAPKEIYGKAEPK